MTSLQSIGDGEDDFFTHDMFETVHVKKFVGM